MSYRHIILIMLYIQFHWHFVITYSNIWLRKIDTLSEKENENDKNTNFLIKNKKKFR